MANKYDLILRGGTIVDPQNGRECVADVGVRDGKIAASAGHLSGGDANDVFDVTGKYVVPGIVDMHMHASHWLGGPWSHKMLALAGVTSALDMSGPVDSVLEIGRDFGCGLTIATVDRLSPGYSIKSDNPGRGELEDALAACRKKGSLGLKIMAGNFPLTPEATAAAVQVANDNRAYVAFHAASTKTGSNIEGFHEAIALAGGNRLHLAHINSYCRGLVRPDLTETQEAVDALLAHPNIRSESYISPINGNNGKCVDGVPEASVIRNCLKTGGFEPTEAGFEKAVLAGWAQIHMLSGGETVLGTGPEARDYWRAADTATGVSFNINPPVPRFRLAVEKRPGGGFVVDAISTDGGGIPRNVIISMGIPLVKFQALTMAEFVLKTSVNPARILGMTNKGHLGEGADADITVIDYEKEKPHMMVGSGKVIMHRGLVCGKGTNILTGAEGAEHVRNCGLNPVVVDLSTSAFYTGL